MCSFEIWYSDLLIPRGDLSAWGVMPTLGADSWEKRNFEVN